MMPLQLSQSEVEGTDTFVSTHTFLKRGLINCAFSKTFQICLLC